MGFNLVRGIGPVRLRALLSEFGDIRAAWTASPAALRSLNLNRRAITNLLRVRQKADLDLILRRAERLGVQILTWDAPDYPFLLSQIADPPLVLYVLGDITPSDEWAIAMVGTRKASVYGKEVAHRLASDVARHGVTVVSGLARGIDGVAHRAALEAGGRTIAVLGSGVDHIYSAEHRKLATEIAANGAVISDYPLGTRREASNFPPRNRLISGLRLGTVVVEAGERSGALITADFALDLGREVLAVPGSILSPGSAGCNRLLRDGAHVVTEARGILEVLRLDQVPEKQAARALLPENPTEAAIFDRLSGEPRHLDDLARAVDIPVAMVSSTLVMMELKGMVRQVGALQYVRAYEPGVPYNASTPGEVETESRST